MARIRRSMQTFLAPCARLGGASLRLMCYAGFAEGFLKGAKVLELPCEERLPFLGVWIAAVSDSEATQKAPKV